MRARLPVAFPASLFYFQTADIVSQVLNFGLSAPIDIQIQDRDLGRSYILAQRLLLALQKIPGVVDAHIPQILDYPALEVDVDRLRAARLGMAQRDVSNNLLVALSSSSLVAPNYFLNPVNNVNYFVAVRLPVTSVKNVNDMMDLAVSQPQVVPFLPTDAQLASLPNAPVSRLSDVASVRPRSASWTSPATSTGATSARSPRTSRRPSPTSARACR
jgi:Cu/Ag efflux pump CusA